MEATTWQSMGPFPADAPTPWGMPADWLKVTLAEQAVCSADTPKDPLRAAMGGLVGAVSMCTAMLLYDDMPRLVLTETIHALAASELDDNAAMTDLGKSGCHQDALCRLGLAAQGP